jgi:hypothetical protein
MLPENVPDHHPRPARTDIDLVADRLSELGVSSEDVAQGAEC